MTSASRNRSRDAPEVGDVIGSRGRSPAPRCRARRGTARAAAPGCARAARSRSRAGARARAWRSGRASCPPPRSCRRDALEEVGEPAPGAVGEIRLVDDVGLARANSLLREPAGLVGVEALVVVGRNADDRAALRLEPRQVRGFVLVALAADQVAVRVVDVRPLELPALHLE